MRTARGPATAVDGCYDEVRQLLDANILMLFSAVRRELGVAQAA